jgi:hypothetical protein
MNKHIIITSINPPSEAIKSFSNVSGYKLIVIGDNKTPKDWQWANVDFIAIDVQKQTGYHLTPLLPENHYCRKNIGYLHAMQAGAAIIYDTDDDNIPYEYWQEPFDEAGTALTTENAGFINILSYYTQQHIWPRGLPLKRIKETPVVAEPDFKDTSKVAVWQGLADNDPDVDAIYRLTNNTPCFFEKKGNIVLNKGTLTSFNSQNTFFKQEVFALLYLPSFVTFRYTDILRSLIAQPVLWAAGYYLGYFKATVYQDRNPHDYMKDFESEIPCYLYPEQVIEIASQTVREVASISENLLNVYIALVKAGIVPEKELPLVEAWIKDVNTLTTR